MKRSNNDASPLPLSASQPIPKQPQISMTTQFIVDIGKSESATPKKNDTRVSQIRAALRALNRRLAESRDLMEQDRLRIEIDAKEKQLYYVYRNTSQQAVARFNGVQDKYKVLDGGVVLKK